MDDLYSNPVPADAEHCCTSKYKCNYLLIPPSNSFLSDSCLKGHGLIDRDDKQRPIRDESCKGREIKWD